ncbi:MAG: discoidin domain-containing protein [Elusimicrobia bacterium]|nr:discoidin domain-containing protein [Elusimicrobiota bacterium]
MTNQLNWPDIRAWGSTEGASLPAAHAVDGDERTRWAGQAIDPQWLAVDFGETRAFDTVRLVWEVAYGKDYLVQVSTDKANWTIVGAVTGGDGGVDEVAVGPQAARYLRVYGLARGTAWGYSLYELDAYGPADPVQETLVGSYGEGTASGEIMGLTNVGAIVAAIQSHRNQILKDGNGNMVIARDKWIAYDYENRPVKVVTAEERHGIRLRRGGAAGEGDGGGGNDVLCGDGVRGAGDGADPIRPRGGTACGAGEQRGGDELLPRGPAGERERADERGGGGDADDGVHAVRWEFRGGGERGDGVAVHGAAAG